jgi:hypothetical protein
MFTSLPTGVGVVLGFRTQHSLTTSISTCYLSSKKERKSYQNKNIKEEILILLHKYYAFDNFYVWIRKIGSSKSLRANKDILQADKRKRAASLLQIFIVNYRQESGPKSFEAFTGSQIIHSPHARSLLYGRSGALTDKATLKGFGRMKPHSRSIVSAM